MARNALNTSKFIKIKDYSAASTAAVTSDIIDMSGYQGVVFLTSFGTANATNSIKVQGNTANQTTGMADLSGTSLASGTSDEDVIVELHKPTFRYLQVVASRGASSTLESVWAYLYGGSLDSGANSVSGTQIAEVHVNVGTGTA
jgi:hypothetical protein